MDTVARQVRLAKVWQARDERQIASDNPIVLQEYGLHLFAWLQVLEDLLNAAVFKAEYRQLLEAWNVNDIQDQWRRALALPMLLVEDSPDISQFLGDWELGPLHETLSPLVYPGGARASSLKWRWQDHWQVVIFAR